MIAPVSGKIISPFGPRRSGYHAGVDYEAKEGTPVSASESGTVVRASWHPDYGNVIVIDHGPIGPNGEHVYSLYAHLKDESMTVKPGDKVSEGQEIGKSGNTGRSTGPHLHYEVIQSPQPLPWRQTGPMGVRGKERRLDPKKYFEEALGTGATVTRRDPLIIDLDGDGIETTNVKDGAYFDHDGNGFAEQTGWAASDDGLLVMDRNGDGIINDGKELFGDQTILSNGQRATNGFQALSDLDSNKDGKIDSNDAAFANLKVWQDIDGDGYSSAEELKSLSDAGIKSINLNSTPATSTDPQGNTQTRSGSFEKTDGTTGTMGEYNLQRDTAYTIANEWLDVPDDIAVLPDLQGYGNVYDLQQAMAREALSGQPSDVSLKNLIEQFTATTDTATRNSLMDQILFKWTGSDTIAPASRGSNIDARKLAVLEKFFGQPFVSQYGANPIPQSAILLKEAYRELSETMYSQLMAQTHLKPLYDKIAYTWGDTAQSVKADLSAVITDIQNRLSTDTETGKALLGEFARTIRGFGAQDMVKFLLLSMLLTVASIRYRSLKVNPSKGVFRK